MDSDTRTWTPGRGHARGDTDTHVNTCTSTSTGTRTRARGHAHGGSLEWAATAGWHDHSRQRRRHEPRPRSPTPGCPQPSSRATRPRPRGPVGQSGGSTATATSTGVDAGAGGCTRTGTAHSHGTGGTATATVTAEPTATVAATAASVPPRPPRSAAEALEEPKVPRSERAHGGAQATPATPATSASCAAHVRSHRRNQRATTRKPQPESCRQRTAARKPRLHVVRLAQTFNRMQLIVEAQGTIGALVATREVGVAMRRRVWHVHAPTRSRNRGGQWLLLVQPNEAGDGTAGESSQAKPGTEFERLESARHDHSRGRGPSTTSRGQQPRPSPESHFHGRSHGQRGDLGATTRGPRPRATAAAHDHDGTTTDLTAAAVVRPLQPSDDSRISSVELGCLSCIPGRERRRNAFAPRPDQHHATRGVRGSHDDARPLGAGARPSWHGNAQDAVFFPSSHSVWRLRRRRRLWPGRWKGACACEPQTCPCGSQDPDPRTRGPSRGPARACSSSPPCVFLGVRGRAQRAGAIGALGEARACPRARHALPARPCVWRGGTAVTNLCLHPIRVTSAGPWPQDEHWRRLSRPPCRPTCSAPSTQGARSPCGTSRGSAAAAAATQRTWRPSCSAPCSPSCPCSRGPEPSPSRGQPTRPRRAPTSPATSSSRTETLWPALPWRVPPSKAETTRKARRRRWRRWRLPSLPSGRGSGDEGAGDECPARLLVLRRGQPRCPVPGESAADVAGRWPPCRPTARAAPTPASGTVHAVTAGCSRRAQGRRIHAGPRWATLVRR